MEFKFVCDCGCEDGTILINGDAVRIECKGCLEQHDLGCDGDTI